MKTAKDEITRLRGKAEKLGQKRFDDRDIRNLLDDIIKTFGAFLPNAKSRKSGRQAKWIYSFGVKGGPLVIIERPHGNRDSIPEPWRSQQIEAALEILDWIESQL